LIYILNLRPKKKEKEEEERERGYILIFLKILSERTQSTALYLELFCYDSDFVCTEIDHLYYY
jgi:hypothetical protein